MHAENSELERAFLQDDMVLVCWEPGCQMHRLSHWQEGKWVTRPQIKGYKNYSHTICRSHYRLCQEEIQRFVTEETAASGARLNKAAAA